ncbi:hypothetical protein Dester_1380 [Desulfurobacterium thermolithotrophum DSM 11699]|uniref:Uncharacterized protein n=2 Tax=Desulfurobacterium thermolithotrophum TaxID=64160 RepID=F0S1K8_DESTD|nr:hypothetical protein Dester_1380 [Desulfurobacterium thermolithotrophum DSM 11699]
MALFLFTFSYGNAFAGTGWFRIEKGHSLYFKPFVDVKLQKDVMVLFVTSKGKIYRGKCREKTIKDACSITPRKRFRDNTESIRYIILRLKKFYAPEVIKTGVVDNLNVKDR